MFIRVGYVHFFPETVDALALTITLSEHWMSPKRSVEKTRDATPGIDRHDPTFFSFPFSWITSPRKMRAFHSVLLGSQLGSQPSLDVVLPPGIKKQELATN